MTNAVVFDRGRVRFGTDMEPKYQAGYTIHTEPLMPPKADSDVVLHDTSGNTLIWRLVKHGKLSWTVRQFNPPKTYMLLKSEWPRCDRIVSVMYP